MPIQPSSNTDKVKKQPADITGRVKDKPTYERDDQNANYGFEQAADINPEGEVTQRQEYDADGLPRDGV